MQTDFSLLLQPHPNLLRVMQEIAPGSPVCRARDKEQPSSGYLTRKSADFLISSPSQAQAILQCKALRNERLTPSLQQEVRLSLGDSALLKKRKRNSC